MERMLDVLKWEKGEDFDIENFQCWAIRPMMYLAKAVVQAEREDQDFLIEVLYEKACEVDECVRRLIGERFGRKTGCPSNIG